jgi:hypothetical protein
MPQCTTKVADQLICPCTTYINRPTTYTPLKAASEEFEQEKCDLLLYTCPAVMCPQPTGGTCDLSTSTCADVTSP